LSDTVKIFERLCKGFPGPTPSFTSIQLLEVFLYIGKYAPVGRKKLSKTLEIGEGVIRNILNRLEKARLIKIEDQGCILTDRGLKILKELENSFLEIGSLNIELPWSYKHNYTVVVRGKAHMVKKGLEQRDAAIRGGAEGAMILTYVDGRVEMPGVCVISEEAPDFASKIIEIIKPQDKDVVIIAGADDLKKAKYGALAALQTLF